MYLNFIISCTLGLKNFQITFIKSYTLRAFQQYQECKPNSPTIFLFWFKWILNEKVITTCICFVLPYLDLLFSDSNKGALWFHSKVCNEAGWILTIIKCDMNIHWFWEVCYCELCGHWQFLGHVRVHIPTLINLWLSNCIVLIKMTKYVVPFACWRQSN